MSGKPRPCAHCGATFRPEFPKGAARTCSPECSKEHRRQTRKVHLRTYYVRNIDALRAHYRRAQAERRARLKHEASA